MIVLAYLHTGTTEHWLHLSVEPLHVEPEPQRAWQTRASYCPKAMGTRMAIEAAIRERFRGQPVRLIAWTKCEHRDNWCLSAVGH